MPQLQRAAAALCSRSGLLQTSGKQHVFFEIDMLHDSKFQFFKTAVQSTPAFECTRGCLELIRELPNSAQLRARRFMFMVQDCHRSVQERRNARRHEPLRDLARRDPQGFRVSQDFFQRFQVAYVSSLIVHSQLSEIRAEI